MGLWCEKSEGGLGPGTRQFSSDACEDSAVVPAGRAPGRAGVPLWAPCGGPRGFHQGVFSAQLPGSLSRAANGAHKMHPNFLSRVHRSSPGGWGPQITLANLYPSVFTSVVPPVVFILYKGLARRVTPLQLL